MLEEADKRKTQKGLLDSDQASQFQSSGIKVKFTRPFHEMFAVLISRSMFVSLQLQSSLKRESQAPSRKPVGSARATEEYFGAVA